MQDRIDDLGSRKERSTEVVDRLKGQIEMVHALVRSKDQAYSPMTTKGYRTALEVADEALQDAERELNSQRWFLTTVEEWLSELVTATGRKHELVQEAEVLREKNANMADFITWAKKAGHTDYEPSEVALGGFPYGLGTPSGDAPESEETEGEGD